MAEPAEPTVERSDGAAQVTAPASPAPVVWRERKQSRLWRRTTMRRAVGEGTLIFVAGRLLAMVPIATWPPALYPLAQVAVLFLSWIVPPWWVAMRVVSTKREKMSRRFWWLGPRLAVVCAAADAVISLALGDASLLTGPTGKPDLPRLFATGRDALPLADFLSTEAKLFVILLVFYTLFVICTRLANGGFMRFTMPAGDGRVTL